VDGEQADLATKLREVQVIVSSLHTLNGEQEPPEFVISLDPSITYWQRIRISDARVPNYGIVVRFDRLAAEGVEAAAGLEQVFIASHPYAALNVTRELLQAQSLGLVESLRFKINKLDWRRGKFKVVTMDSLREDLLAWQRYMADESAIAYESLPEETRALIDKEREVVSAAGGADKLSDAIIGMLDLLGGHLDDKEDGKIVEFDPKIIRAPH
jgi:hypothetical protein